MTAQTSYSINQPIAVHGQLYSLSPNDIVSRLAEGVAGIGVGVAVSRGTDIDRQMVLGGATNYLGITVRSLDRENDVNTGDVIFLEKAAASVLRKGYIYLICPTGCTAGALVFYDDTTGVVDAGTAGAGETQITNAYWDTTAAAGEIAVVVLETTANTAGS